MTVSERVPGDPSSTKGSDRVKLGAKTHNLGDLESQKGESKPLRHDRCGRTLKNGGKWGGVGERTERLLVSGWEGSGGRRLRGDPRPYCAFEVSTEKSRLRVRDDGGGPAARSPFHPETYDG